MSGLAEALGVLWYSLRCKAARNGAIAASITAILCLSVALAWWGPAKREQTRLLQDIGIKRAAMAEAVRADQVASAQRKALKAVAQLEKKLEMRAGQADLIQGVARHTAKRNVRVTSQSFDEGRTQSGEASLYLDIGLLGNYEALRLLLDDLAALPMWVEVVEARIERADESGAQVRAQLRLLTYRRAKGQP